MVSNEGLSGGVDLVGARVSACLRLDHHRHCPDQPRSRRERHLAFAAKVILVKLAL